MVWIVAFLGVALAADCDDPVSRGELGTLLGEADVAFSDMDRDGLVEAGKASVSAVPCVDFTLNPPDIAHVFRARGFSLMVEESASTAMPWLQAAARLQGGYELDERFRAGPLGVSWDAARSAPPPSLQALAAPAGGFLHVDGVRVSEAPEGQPFVIQRFSDDGALEETVLVGPGEAVPVYPVAGAEPVASTPGPSGPEPASSTTTKQVKTQEVKNGPRTSRTLAVAAGAVGVLAGAALGGAAATKNAYEEGRSTNEATYALNQGLGYSGYSLAVASGGLIVSAVIVGEW